MLDKLFGGTRTLLSTDTSQADGETDDRAMPDARRVRELLADHDGRLWQTEIVEKTGWTKSKTSRTLGSMEADERIVRYRIGRRKLVCVPGRVVFEPEA